MASTTKPTSQAGIGRRQGAFALLGVSPSLASLIRYFTVRPQAHPHLRLLQHRLGLGSASVQRDLKRLATAGVLRASRDPEQRTVHYGVVPHRFWVVARALVAASDEPATLLREALRDVPGVEAAFLFGSSATGAAQPESDVDVLVVGDAVDARALYRNLFEVGQVLDRQVNTLRYTRAILAQRLASGAEFPRSVLEGPKIWLAGDPAAIAPIAAAAGVRFRADGHGLVEA
jgi:predicted nucleotidyltransferase